MIRSDERGIALVAALFMTLILSLIGSSLMFVARTETLSSLNYKTMSQGRYGAESGLHIAANHLMYTYAPPATAGADPIGTYDTTTSPVEFNNSPVVLSSDPSVSNYPIAAVQNAFAVATNGTLNVGTGSVRYGARATLLSMRQVLDDYSKQMVTLQTWEITGVGTLPGAGAANVEVSAIVDRQMVPVFRYAAFSTLAECNALSFRGGARTDSYDSSTALPPGTAPTLDNWGADVGTNGGLTDAGADTTIAGTLSTPRTGVGLCGPNSVTAATNGLAPQGGMVKLPQNLKFTDPPPPNPLPPVAPTNFGSGSGCPAGLVGCAVSANGATITPGGNAVVMGDVSIGSGAELHLRAGTYIINSFTMNANAKIIVDPPGEVIFQIAGQGFDAGETVVKITGNGISNETYNPKNLQFIYAGPGDIDIAGGAQTSALVYAPNATGKFTGGSHFYGAVVLKQLTASGGAMIHYDRSLGDEMLIPGNFTMNQFTWSAF